MIKKINLIIATVYAIVLALVETLLNWGNWQYAPLWIVDYLIVIILLLGVFVYKESQRKVLLYMALFINLEPSSTLTTFDSNILYSIGLAIIVSFVGIVLTMIDD